MIPGGGGMNPRQLKQMMKKLGIEVEDFPEVLEITIETTDGVFKVEDATVTKMSAQGETTLQVQGDVKKVGETETKSIAEQDTSEVEVEISQEDIDLVTEQTGATEEEAREALQEVGGNPAEAIIKLS